MSKLGEYLKDPFLKELYEKVRSAGALRSVSIDITKDCNLRCKGCYFFEEGMDRVQEGNDEQFLDWIKKEKDRGTNMVTIVGGEPALQPNRIKLLYDNFRINVATNGLIKIPMEGLENLPIGVAVWGNAKTDSSLRANGRRLLFHEALNNYKGDKRAFWYYTVATGMAHEIEEVVEQCVNNGNRVLFNYYSDLSQKGGDFGNSRGFDRVINEIERMIEKYPEFILTTRYLNNVVGSGKLFDEQWGYNTCTNITPVHPVNKERVMNGNPYNPHFRAYNSDFTTVRRCCTGLDRGCDTCFDTWEHFSWIMINVRKHLSSIEDFANWLFVMYSFYTINKFINITESELNENLRRIHNWKRNKILTLHDD